MLECIFTLDYEIYGNGTGSLEKLVYEPAEVLAGIFKKWKRRFVNFVEVAELERIETFGTDAAIELVKRQIRELYQDGFEIGLHLHPQWCNARYEDNHWVLDENEYNLCVLSRSRISQIVQQSLEYLRCAVLDAQFTPLSFRAGNWLFQPTAMAAEILGAAGIRIDSSVFKGGLQRYRGLDYRLASRNGYYWKFSDDVNRVNPAGSWVEVPIHTEMVPPWRMSTAKRMSFASNSGTAGGSLRKKIDRALDLARPRYPMKFDFCRMTLDELVNIVNKVLQEDRRDPSLFRPIVAIGHTKDLRTPEVVDHFLAFLDANEVPVSTFQDACTRLIEVGTENVVHELA